MKRIPLIASLLLVVLCAVAQADSARVTSSPEKKKKRWFENVRIRGYMQVRYNRLLESNPKLRCEQCDRSWGDGGGISLRRMRVIFFGQLHPRVFFYIQPDFASSPGGNLMNFAQLRDAYVDLGVDNKSEFRFRIGQSKIPYGFECMQSSQNRLPLDRSDAINSAFSNERDLGVFFYWAPEKIRNRFADLVNSGLKGSGDYGVVGVGVFNGQGLNQPALNKGVHIVARATYPFQIKKQIVEASVQAYSGKYELDASKISQGVKYRADRLYLDQRVAGSFVLYPQPFGMQVEYNVGRGPQFDRHTGSIETRFLHGGYALVNYMIGIKKHKLIPFTRAHFYQGGKKHETDARSYWVNEYEVGVEWQPLKYFEFVAMYTYSKRRFEDFKLPNNYQEGGLLRLQAQLNF